MSDESPLPRLRELQDEIAGQNGMWGAVGLRKSTGEAMGIARLSGLPATIEAIGDDYRRAETILDRASETIHTIRVKDLATWVGGSQDSAALALIAGDHKINDSARVIGSIGQALHMLADELERQQRADASGIGRLEWAHEVTQEITAGPVPDPVHYDGDRMYEAHQLARTGIADRVDAHARMIAKSREISATFSGYVERAVLDKLLGSGPPGLNVLVQAGNALTGGT